jgi:ABC-type uncharacterized transport system permease subunit
MLLFLLFAAATATGTLLAVVTGWMPTTNPLESILSSIALTDDAWVAVQQSYAKKFRRPIEDPKHRNETAKNQLSVF